MQVFQYGQAEIDYLTRRDRKLGRAIGRIGMIERQVTPDLFTALIRSIVAQQISSKAADTVWGRLSGKLLNITPRTVAVTDVSDIQKCGLSMRKATYIKGIGAAAVYGEEVRTLRFSGISVLVGFVGSAAGEEQGRR